MSVGFGVGFGPFASRGHSCVWLQVALGVTEGLFLSFRNEKNMAKELFEDSDTQSFLIKENNSLNLQTCGVVRESNTDWLPSSEIYYCGQLKLLGPKWVPNGVQSASGKI